MIQPAKFGFLAPALALILCPAPLIHAQLHPASVTGVVVDRRTQQPIFGALIRVLTSGQEARSDSNGRFRQEGVSPGPHVIHVRAVGYSSAAHPLIIAAGEVVQFRVELELLAYEMEGVTVAGDRGGIRFRDFERRRTAGVGGVFLTEEEIRQRPARTLAELLRAVPGIEVNCRIYGCDLRMPRGCRPEYFLDGFPATFATGPDFPLMGVRGIEVYRTEAETPAEFQRPNARCGAIVIWSAPDL